MKNIIKASFIMMLTFSLMSTLSAKKATVQLNLNKGDQFTTQLHMDNTMNQEMMGMKINMEQKMEMTSGMKVIDEKSDGSWRIEQTYSRIKMDMLMNGKAMKIDTDSPDSDPKFASLNKLIDMVISFDVTPLGKVSNMEGMEEMINKLQENQQAAAMLKGLTNEDMLVSFFSYIPQKSVKTGESYLAKVKMEQMMSMEVETEYTVTGITKKLLNLDMSTDIEFSPDKPIEQNGMKMIIEGTGVQSGDFIVDRKTGMPVSSNMTQKMEMNMSFKNPENGENISIPMKVNTTATTVVTKTN